MAICHSRDTQAPRRPADASATTSRYSVHELLLALRVSGMKLWLDGDRLRVQATKGVVSDDLRQALAEHREVLIAMLKGSRGFSTQAPRVLTPDEEPP